ncbi:CGNR zinc finger domain-containing protein [Streptomyces sp. NPDC085524]|uniref:CGNR zinc finger domain-containing protein n=1 Tax=unclassified Streptomyces TaxID=2593676 RepID=UPI0035E3330E
MRFDSGRVCLDLVATERIRDGEALRTWLAGAGLVPDRTPLARVGPDWVAAFQALRRDVEALVRAELDGTEPGGAEAGRRGAERGGPGPGGPEAGGAGEGGAEAGEAALARVNALAAGSPPGLCAVRDQDGHLVRELCGGVECGALLAAVARDAVELLTDPGDLALLRACAGDGCARVYLDTSRGHRRRWCSSELCGNRERVARHRRRALAAGGG